MTDKKISELDQTLILSDQADFPLSQDNGGEPTTFRAKLTQIATKIAEAITFSNLKTGNKQLVSAVNQTISNLADDFNTTAGSTYAKDDCVLYNGILYQCIKNSGTTSGTFIAADWTAIKAVDAGSGGGGSSTLAGLSDVDITTTTPTNNQVLKYDSANQKWVNGSALEIKSVVFNVVASHPTDPSTYSVTISVGNTTVFSKGYSCTIWGEFSATTSSFVYDGIEYTVVAQGFRAINQGATCFRLSINNVAYEVPLANRQNSSFATSDSFSILVKTGSITASDIFYDNSASGLQADNLQDAIDELVSLIQGT